MNARIFIQLGHDVRALHDPMDMAMAIELRDLRPDNMDALDSIIKQCRDIKMKLLEEGEHGATNV